MPSLGHPACHAEQCSVLESLPMRKGNAPCCKFLTVTHKDTCLLGKCSVVGDVGLILGSQSRQVCSAPSCSLACKPLSPEPAPVFALLVPLQVLDLCAE